MRKLRFGPPLAFALAGLAGSVCLLARRPLVAGDPARRRAPRAAGARARGRAGRRRCGSCRRVPAFEPPGREPGAGLPRLVLPDEPGAEAFRAGARIPVREVRIRGNTALPDAELAAIAKPYRGARARLRADPGAARRAHARLHPRGLCDLGRRDPGSGLARRRARRRDRRGPARGDRDRDGRPPARRAISSRASIPAAASRSTSTRCASGSRCCSRTIGSAPCAPSWLPGERLGESVLRVAIDEARAWDLELGANNYVTPSLGDVQGEVRLAHRNLTGFADVLERRLRGAAEGLHDLRPAYQIPFTRWDTRLGLNARWTWSEIVEDPFDDLDIENETQSYAISLHQPLLHSPSSLVEIFASGEYRRSDSFLFGDRFSFVAGSERGVSKIAVLRGGLEWTFRSPEQVLALRGHALGRPRRARRDAAPRRHAARRAVRGRPAPAAVGAPAAVLEPATPSRAPTCSSPTGRCSASSSSRSAGATACAATARTRSCATAAPTARSSSTCRSRCRASAAGGPGSSSCRSSTPATAGTRAGIRSRAAKDQDLVSAGIGARIDLTSQLAFEVFWGASLADVDSIGEDSLQDHGVHLGLRWVSLNFAIQSRAQV